MERRPVLFFDSGIGGLSVVKEARILLPEHPYVYVADDAAFPYGAWEEEALRARLIKLFGRLIDRFEPSLIVIACNTASTLAISDLRAAYPDQQFVGTVPAIKPAAERSRTGGHSQGPLAAARSVAERSCSRSFCSVASAFNW